MLPRRETQGTFWQHRGTTISWLKMGSVAIVAFTASELNSRGKELQLYNHPDVIAKRYRRFGPSKQRSISRKVVLIPTILHKLPVTVR